ncbi:MAG: hypothetical protein WEB58_12800 [Planctomycetaceae bacterium]
MVATAIAPGGGRHNRPQTKSGLSPSRCQLVELMQDINFGRLESLRISNADPLLDPIPGIVREIKFCAENGPRPERYTDDFALKSQVVEMFEYLDRIRDCQIELLEIKHGLPFRMLIREDAV